ncbi:MAG: acyl-CoA/acyl-ACP dehydrogenase [Dehalococcoidia bacterium]|nr:MAG: acyl-CoA/acyl-ACP dehydrogenase [Dehalococcoidia bacterium]
MDFALNEHQEMLKNTARDFLVKECPKTLVREMEKDEKGYSPEMWKKMADLGWMGLVFPEEYGGNGLSILDFAVLLEEMGRAIVPGPFLSTVVCGGLTILRWGSEEQKKELLPKISAGELILALALTEPSASYDAADIAVSAVPDGDDFVINGTKLFVENAHIADHLICVARTKESENKQDGITVFLVDARSPGISSSLLQTFTADKQCEVVFDRVRVPKANITGKLDQGWEVVEDIIQQAAFAQCPWMVGGAQQILEMATEYAKERIQFGRPIGSFQAIQHKCANMATDIAGARDITYQTAWKISEGLPYRQDISLAKAWTCDAYRKACVEGIQIHGGIGITQEYDVQLYYRRAKAMEIAFGDADYHLEMVARQMGL